VVVFDINEGTNREMKYRLAEDGSHELKITGPELANIAKLVASLRRKGDHAARVSVILFHALGFHKVYAQSKLDGEKESCFEKVYKRSRDGKFQWTFTDAEYQRIANLLLTLDNCAQTIGRKLFNSLGYPKLFREFINSSEGQQILLSTSTENGHA
jgi:hypothetical protein